MAKTPRIRKARKPRTRKPKTVKPIAVQAVKKPSHRVPPKPASWNCARGTCRFCGLVVLNDDGSVNRRKHWHTACGELWFLMNNPGEASRVIKLRDNYTCQHCGVHDRFGAFQVDHVKPLFEAQGDPTYWQPGNLTLLCVECHKIKTRSDMVRWRALQKVDDSAS